MAQRFNFKSTLAKFERLQKRLPELIGTKVVNHTKEAFRKGGFTDEVLTPWAARKRPNKADKATKRKRALLVDSGNLRKSIRVSKATFREIRVGAYGIDYATYHNQGIKGRLPQRKFLGKSAVLDRKIQALIRAEMKKVFQ